MIAEPDVTLTDWALALEAGMLAVLGGRAAMPRAWVMFFGSIAAAAFLGGITHGFFAEGRGVAAAVLWRTTLLALGMTSVAAVTAGAQALRPTGNARPVCQSAVVAFVVYTGVVLFLSDAFVVAVVAYVPATVFLLVVFVVVQRRMPSRAPLAGAAGIGVLWLGSWVQWRGVALPALGLSPNALYHVIEMIAVPLIYGGARGLGGPRRG